MKALRNYKVSKTLDGFVRWLLSAAGHEDILLHFINTVLADSGDTIVDEVEVMNPFSLRKTRKEKELVLDVKARCRDGTMADIEIQTTPHPGYEERAFDYAARLKVDELKQGKSWKQTTPVIGIHLCDFVLFRGNSRGHEVFGMQSRHTTGLALDCAFSLHFLQMPRILSMDSLPKERTLTPLEKLILWFIFDKEEQEPSQDVHPAFAGEPIFDRMQKEYLDFMTKEELIYYAQSRDFFIYDQNAFKQIAREEGFEEGKQAGLEQGLENGLFNVARTMIAQEFPLETIATVTGLSIEVIERIAKEEGEQGVGD